MLGNKLPEEDVFSVLRGRAASEWLYQGWPDFEKEWPQPTGPGGQALYLALGWFQANVTWLYPGTPRWIVQFETEAEHWLPRYLQNLCRWTCEQDNDTLLQACHQALAEGKSDTALPGYAAALDHVLPRKC